jgi:hypothetical protein
LESRIPADHPLRAIRELVDVALRDLSFWYLPTTGQQRFSVTAQAVNG